MSQEERQCQNCKTSFVVDASDFAFYEHIQVPPPTFCPACRFQRRLAYRNERNLYRRKCNLCGEVRVSYFSPSSPYVVYCPPCWWSDKWDAIEYAQEYDPSRPFLEQFFELRRRVPQQGLATNPSTMVNSDYCHMANNLRNCYLVTHANEDENCFYSSALLGTKDSGELLSCAGCELCLEDVHCYRCHRTYFSLDCEDCHNVAFSRNCVGCSDCFGCVNLRNKRYHLFNEPLSREEYLGRLQALDVGSYRILEEVRVRARTSWEKFPQKYIHGRHNANVSGDYIYHSKNAHSCYDVVHTEDSKYCAYLTTKPIAQCYDYDEWGNNAERVYECMNVGENVTNVKFSQQSWGEDRNLDYTSFCIASSDLFGCVSLRHKEYCILNKRYPREEYEELRARIIADINARPYKDKKGREYRYGEFFPIELSFWGYNETTANEFFPLAREEAEAEGYPWTNIEKQRGVYQQTMKAEEFPDHIRNVPQSLVSEIIACSKCGKSYRFTKQELDFYKSQNIALPRWCPECRYTNRFNQRNPYRLHHRTCQCSGTRSVNGAYQNKAEHFHKGSHCPTEFETAYAPDRKEIVYCEQCYNAEIV